MSDDMVGFNGAEHPAPSALSQRVDEIAEKIPQVVELVAQQVEHHRALVELQQAVHALRSHQGSIELQARATALDLAIKAVGEAGRGDLEQITLLAGGFLAWLRAPAVARQE